MINHGIRSLREGIMNVNFITHYYLGIITGISWLALFVCVFLTIKAAQKTDSIGKRNHPLNNILTFLWLLATKKVSLMGPDPTTTQDNI